MSRTIKTKELLPHNWLTIDKPNNELIDQEMIEITLLGARKKYIDALENKNFKYFYELVYHTLNINTFIDENRMYDTKLKKIKNDEMLNRLLVDFKEDSKFSITANVILNSKEILDESLTQYLEEITDYLSDGVFYFENKQLHFGQDKLFIIITDGKTNKFQIWKLEFNNKFTFTHQLTLIETFNYYNDGNDTELRDIISNFNKDHNDQILTNNSFYVNMNKRNSLSKGIYLAKDILTMNRIFIGSKDFNPYIFKSLLSVINTENTFPYHLTPSM